MVCNGTCLSILSLSYVLVFIFVYGMSVLLTYLPFVSLIHFIAHYTSTATSKEQGSLAEMEDGNYLLQLNIHTFDLCVNDLHVLRTIINTKYTAAGMYAHE